MSNIKNGSAFVYDKCTGKQKINEKYVVNGGTTTCILTCREDLAIMRFSQANAFFAEYFQPGYEYPIGIRFPKNWFIKPKYVGIATCGPDNDFDAGIGRGYAYNRAFSKLMVAVNQAQGNIVRDILNNLMNCIETTSDTQDKANGSYIANLIRLNKLAAVNANNKAGIEMSADGVHVLTKGDIISPNYKHKNGSYFGNTMHDNLYEFVTDQYKSMTLENNDPGD